jgi:hypothetical protein
MDMEERFFLAFTWFSGFVVVVVIGFLFYSVYQSVMSEKIELPKSEWECTNSKTETRLQPMLMGKTTLLQPITATVCTNYTRSK